MQNDKDDKKRAVQFFQIKNIEARNYPKTNNKENPDFELYVDNKIFGLCELKSIIKYHFSGFRADPTFNKIQQKIHKASNQFRASDPEHELSHVILFVNHDEHIRYQDLKIVLTGDEFPNGEYPELFEPRYRNRLLRKNDLDFDFIVWIEANTHRVFYIYNEDSKFSDLLKDKISKKMYEHLNV